MLWGVVTTLREHSPIRWCRAGVLWEEVVKKHSMTGRALRVAAAGGILLGVLAPTAAFAADYPAGSPPGDPGDPGSQVAANTASNSSTLPFTGSDVAGLAAIGAGAALAGVVMVRHSKRTRATA
jgi:hypothetical protein